MTTACQKSGPVRTGAAQGRPITTKSLLLFWLCDMALALGLAHISFFVFTHFMIKDMATKGMGLAAG